MRQTASPAWERVRGACLAALLCAPAAQAARAAEAEFLVKAAFLYNFAKFVEWPESQAAGAFSLCVLGRNPFGDALESLEGKQVKGRDLVIVAIEEAEEADACHMVFVAESERQRLGDILLVLEERHALSVSDMEDFASRGGMIGLLKLGNKIRFEVNIASAQAAGLSISSSLLRLARTVHKKSHATNDT